MKTEHTASGTSERRRRAKARVETKETSKAKDLAPVAAGVMSGAAAGAVAGAVAGPPGAVAGAVIGGAVGAAAGKAIESHEAEEAAVRDELDEAIGVTSPNLGAARRAPPPATRGTFSAESSGAGGRDVPPAEGDIAPAEREDT